MTVASLCRPTREVSLPVFHDTACAVCGADDAVGVRYCGIVLCLDCYRKASRAGRRAARASERRARYVRALDQPAPQAGA